MTKALPTQARLKELLDYDLTTGKLYRKISTSNCVKVGDKAGCLASDGYIYIRIDSILYSAHRLIWMWHHNQDPDKLQIDHINGCRSDNRIENLRLCTQQKNMCNRTKLQSNNTSGITGVYWWKPSKSWKATICVNNKFIYLGYFKTIEEAAAARQAAELEYFGTFAPIKSVDPISNVHAS